MKVRTMYCDDPNYKCRNGSIGIVVAGPFVFCSSECIQKRKIWLMENNQSVNRLEIEEFEVPADYEHCDECGGLLSGCSKWPEKSD